MRRSPKGIPQVGCFRDTPIGGSDPHATHGTLTVGPLKTRIFVAAALAALLAACSSGHSTSHIGAPTPTTHSTTGPTPSAGSLCGFLPSARPDKVLVIWEENHSYGDVIGASDAPTFNAIASSCGSATNYQAVTHPSLPNYLAMTSGGVFARSPYNGDCSAGGTCVVNGASVFSQEAQAGHSWASFAESMPAPCDPNDSGPYAVRHNPAVYYRAIATACTASDLPMGTPSSGPLSADLRTGTLPTLTTVTPNVDHDMHDGTVAEADAWLGQWLPVITGGPDYRSGRLDVVIAWDEGNGSGNHASSAPLLVLSAALPPGSRASAALNDYSVLGAIEEISGLPPLGQVPSAESVTAAFGLTGR
jgi:phosphatidylinositol-3-phosphatase